MQTAKADTAAGKALTGRGALHFVAKTTKILAPRPEETTTGPDHTPHRANRALEQIRRLKWIRSAIAGAATQDKPIDMIQIRHVTRPKELPNQQDHCYRSKVTR